MLKRFSSALLTSALLVSADAAVWAKPPDLPLNFREVCTTASEEQTTPPAAPAIPPGIDLSNESSDLSWLDSIWKDYFNCDTVMEGVGYLVGAVNSLGDTLSDAVSDLVGSFYQQTTTTGGEVYGCDYNIVIPPPAQLAVTTAKDGTQIIGCNFESSIPIMTTAASDDAAEDYRQHSARRFYEIGRACQSKGDFAMARNCYEEAVHMCPGSEFAQQAKAACVAMKQSGLDGSDLGTNAQPSRMTYDRVDGNVGSGAEAQELPPAQAIPAPRDSQKKLSSVRSLYRKGMESERQGDTENAFRYYREVVETMPDSPEGRKAKERMIRLEEIESPMEKEPASHERQ